MKSNVDINNEFSDELRLIEFCQDSLQEHSQLISFLKTIIVKNKDMLIPKFNMINSDINLFKKEIEQFHQEKLGFYTLIKDFYSLLEIIHHKIQNDIPKSINMVMKYYQINSNETNTLYIFKNVQSLIDNILINKEKFNRAKDELEISNKKLEAEHIELQKVKEKNYYNVTLINNADANLLKISEENKRLINTLEICTKELKHSKDCLNLELKEKLQEVISRNFINRFRAVQILYTISHYNQLISKELSIYVSDFIKDKIEVAQDYMGLYLNDYGIPSSSTNINNVNKFDRDLTNKFNTQKSSASNIINFNVLNSKNAMINNNNNNADYSNNMNLMKSITFGFYSSSNNQNKIQEEENNILSNLNDICEKLSLMNLIDINNINSETLINYSDILINCFKIISRNMLYRRKMMKYSLKNFCKLSKFYQEFIVNTKTFFKYNNYSSISEGLTTAWKLMTENKMQENNHYMNIINNDSIFIFTNNQVLINNKYKSLIENFEDNFKLIEKNLKKNKQRVYELFIKKEKLEEEKRIQVLKSGKLSNSLQNDEIKLKNSINEANRALLDSLNTSVTFFNETGKKSWKEESLLLNNFISYLKVILNNYKETLNNSMIHCCFLKEYLTQLDLSSDIKNSFSEMLMKYQVGDSFLNKIIRKVIKSTNFEEDKIYYSQMFTSENDNLFKCNFNLNKNYNIMSINNFSNTNNGKALNDKSAIILKNHAKINNENNDINESSNTGDNLNNNDIFVFDSNNMIDKNRNHKKSSLSDVIENNNNQISVSPIALDKKFDFNSNNTQAIAANNQLHIESPNKQFNQNYTSNEHALSNPIKIHKMPFINNNDKSQNEIKNIVSNIGDDDDNYNDNDDFDSNIQSEWSSDSDQHVDFIHHSELPVFDLKKNVIKDKELKKYLEKLEKTNNQNNKKKTDKNDKENAIESFNCAYSDKILLQGSLKVYKTKIIFKSLFNAKTFLGATKLEVPIADIVSIEKKNLLVFDNSIQINTNKQNLFFTSFISRDNCYDLITKFIQEYNDNNNKENLEDNKNKDNNSYDKTYNNTNCHSRSEFTEKITKQLINDALEEHFNKLEINQKLKELTERRIKKILNLESKPMNDVSFFPNMIMDKEYLTDAPLSLIYGVIFDLNVENQFLEQNKPFWESLYSLRKDKNIENIETDNYNDIPEFFKDTAQCYALFSNLSSHELDKFYTSVDNWSSHTKRITKFLHYIGKKIVGPSEVNLEEHMYINFVSPSLLVVESRTYGINFIYSDCFVAYIQYRFNTDYGFDHSTGKVKFTTTLTCIQNTQIVKSCLFASTIKSEGKSESTESLKYNIYPKMKGALELANSESKPFFLKLAEDVKRKRIKKLKLKDIKNETLSKKKSEKSEDKGNKIENSFNENQNTGLESIKETESDLRDNIIKKESRKKSILYFNIAGITAIIGIFVVFLALIMLCYQNQIDILELLTSDRFFKIFSLIIISILSWKVYTK